MIEEQVFSFQSIIISALLLFCSETPSNKCPGYDIKQSDSETPVILELWGIWSTPSLPMFPGPFWPRVIVPDIVLSMG